MFLAQIRFYAPLTKGEEVEYSGSGICPVRVRLMKPFEGEI